jgi:nicotinate phosphoribosyltransferase
MSKFFSSADTEKIRKGYYSAKYFNRTKSILLKEKNFKEVTMQVFQREKDTVLCGIAEVLELFKTATGYFKEEKWVDKSEELTITSLLDGDTVDSLETVMHIKGPYVYFAHLESAYLGILARRTAVATRVRQIVAAAKGKQVLFFADRFDHFSTQVGDGYAAYIGGATAVATDAQALLWNGQAVGTIPHAFIAINNGDTIAAAKLFCKYYPEVPLIALVDFDNDCIGTSLTVAKTLGKKLWGVRVDTAASLKDVSVKRLKGTVYGVNPILIKLLRKALDENGFSAVKIIVSGGFDKDRVEKFEKEKTPVDIYGIGSWFVQGTIPFTADVVQVEGKKTAKAGRTLIDNPRLKNVSLFPQKI